MGRLCDNNSTFVRHNHELTKQRRGHRDNTGSATPGLYQREKNTDVIPGPAAELTT